MARKDIYHETVIDSLDDDGWKITDDPFRIGVGETRLEMDLGAEKLISAEKGTRKIIVEIKSFIGRSPVEDLQQALGKYSMYERVLIEEKVDREIYLAVPLRAYRTIFQDKIGQILLDNNMLRLLVFDESRKVIVEWIPS